MRHMARMQRQCKASAYLNEGINYKDKTRRIWMSSLYNFGFFKVSISGQRLLLSTLKVEWMGRWPCGVYGLKKDNLAREGCCV